MLSMTTDYAKSTGWPEPYLRRIAAHGFTHVHWCHHWNTDFLYSEPEVNQIAQWLDELGLGVTDLHGSSGAEKDWMALEEYRRLSGVELVENRIRMVARLGSDVVIMHIPALSPKEQKAAQWDQTRRTFDDLEPCARKCGVRIAIENGDFNDIRQVLSLYAPDYMGLCYDSGHGNTSKTGLDDLETLKDRLISIHLHDNNGSEDEHRLVFSGTADWPRLAGIIARSSYDKWVSMETTIHKTGIKDEDEFLARAFEAGTEFARMIEQAGG